MINLKIPKSEILALLFSAYFLSIAIFVSWIDWAIGLYLCGISVGFMICFIFLKLMSDKYEK